MSLLAHLHSPADAQNVLYQLPEGFLSVFVLQNVTCGLKLRYMQQTL